MTDSDVNTTRKCSPEISMLVVNARKIKMFQKYPLSVTQTQVCSNALVSIVTVDMENLSARQCLFNIYGRTLGCQHFVIVIMVFHRGRVFRT